MRQKDRSFVSAKVEYRRNGTMCQARDVPHMLYVFSMPSDARFLALCCGLP